MHVLFWNVSDYSYSIFSHKIKQHLAMSAIQNHKALWRKKRQCCDVKDVKRKTKTPATSKSLKAKNRFFLT